MSATDKPSDKPNILLITTDQQRFDALRCSGNPHIFTPHLDGLADRGVMFSRAYADAPVCGPSRASILTGRYHATNAAATGDGWFPVKNQPTLPSLLTGAGYQTKAVGKMHFEPPRKNYGFEHMEILQDYYRYMSKHPHLGVPMDHGVGQNEFVPVFSTVEESNSLTHWTVDRSIDFLETRDASRPFFLWTSFSKPHAPYDVDPRYWELYRDAEVPEPFLGQWSEDPARIPQGFMVPNYLMGNAHRFNKRDIQMMRRAYYACVTQIDYNLGLLFSRMREMRLLDKTWIIFTSDHGDMLGDHHMGGKHTFYEGSCHVPMLLVPPCAHNPGYDKDITHTLAGTSCNSVASMADILPTCLQLAGATPPDNLDGLSLLDIASGSSPRDTLYGNFDNIYMVLEGKWKYHLTTCGGGEQLFNLADDPQEQRDLSEDPSCSEVFRDLRGKAIARFGALGHAGFDKPDLKANDAPKDGAEVRRQGGWPGHHSRQFPVDVLH